MDRALRNQIIRLWNAMLPMEQIYQMLPCKIADAKRYVANLRKDGTLKPRCKKEHSMSMVANAYNNGITNVDELAEMFNFTKGTIIEYLNKQGIHRERPTSYITVTSERTSQIIKDIKEAKYTQTQLAKKYGVSRQYIHYLSTQI